jgi:hypothetical protein
MPAGHRGESLTDYRSFGLFPLGPMANASPQLTKSQARNGYGQESVLDCKSNLEVVKVNQYLLELGCK